MKTDYMIVQAGGKGTRLEHLTTNKPKALVPVKNLPMLFHLFRKFPDKKFIIIADYKREVLHSYLEAFGNVKYQIVDADGEGTCGGLRQAIELLPENEPFMLVWSDLILPQSFEMPEEPHNYVGISQKFPCRWKYENGKFTEERSIEHGVAGLFIFKEKAALKHIPKSGELVRWLSQSKEKFEVLGLAGTQEFGTLEEYNKLAVLKTRPFNSLTISEKVVIKKAVDEQGEILAEREKAWYEFAKLHSVAVIPQIFDTNPLKMERIDGGNIYEQRPSLELLSEIVAAIKQLHTIKSQPADSFSVSEAYYGKTMSRLDKIRDLVPFADRHVILVNGRECRNIFFYRRDFEQMIKRYKCKTFAFIHGDCTFSNIMLRKNGAPVLLDPRGYFGYTELFGDPNYDWAKLFYSIVGNYDRFNLRDFRLMIKDNAVHLNISSNGWENLENDFFRLSGVNEKTIRLIHATIWLSLTTYAWQDYDSICGAFYNGLYYLEELL